MSLVEELNDRCRELTGGFIPNVVDARKIVQLNAILIIQRYPGNLARHRVTIMGSGITHHILRQLVELEWQDNEINP